MTPNTVHQKPKQSPVQAARTTAPVPDHAAAKRSAITSSTQASRAAARRNSAISAQQRFRHHRLG